MKQTEKKREKAIFDKIIRQLPPDNDIFTSNITNPEKDERAVNKAKLQ